MTYTQTLHIVVVVQLEAAIGAESSTTLPTGGPCHLAAAASSVFPSIYFFVIVTHISLVTRWGNNGNMFLGAF